MTYDDVLKEPSREYELEEIIEDLIYVINNAYRVKNILTSTPYKRAVKAVNSPYSY